MCEQVSDCTRARTLLSSCSSFLCCLQFFCSLPSHPRLKIALDFGGWREFIVPFSSFEVARKPAGWGKIDKVHIFSREYLQQFVVGFSSVGVNDTLAHWISQLPVWALLMVQRTY